MKLSLWYTRRRWLYGVWCYINSRVHDVLTIQKTRAKATIMQIPVKTRLSLLAKNLPFWPLNLQGCRSSWLFTLKTPNVYPPKVTCKLTNLYYCMIYPETTIWTAPGWRLIMTMYIGTLHRVSVSSYITVKVSYFTNTVDILRGRRWLYGVLGLNSHRRRTNFL